MEARNRTLTDWFTRIRTGQVLLPRFQRHEAWGPREVTSLLQSVLRDLPTGAALILEIGDEQPFIARCLVGAPEPTERVTEHLLDGQQRLTALWRALHDDYDDRIYLVGLEEDEHGSPETVVRAHKIHYRNDERYPRWLDEPAKCWERSWIPLSLCRPGAPPEKVDEWADLAAKGDNDQVRSIDRRIRDYSTSISNFNVPFLSLPPGTPRETALDVFINMNTSSVKLSAYDIVVAQYEAAKGESLHDHVAELEAAVPRLEAYRDAENLLLDIAVLRQDMPVNQTSYHRLDLRRLSDEFEELVKGAAFAVEVLEAEGIFDSARLPTVAVIAVLGAIQPHIRDGGDERGNAMSVIRGYLWRSFTTNRYENSANTRVLQDLRGMIGELEGRGNSAPVFDEDQFTIPTSEELISARWPKTRQTLPRAILCASLRRGAFDLADGTKAGSNNMISREYHHLFPEAYLARESDLERHLVYRSLNCALITWSTNRRIGAKPPLTYLRDRVEMASLGETEVRRRLESHLIPWDEFARSPGGDVEKSYRNFLEARANLVGDYLIALCDGQEPNV